MRDVVWTLIVIWVVYKLVAIFKNGASKKAGNHFDTNGQSEHHSDSEKKKSLRNSLNNEGEYVDFVEVKEEGTTKDKIG